MRLRSEISRGTNFIVVHRDLWNTLRQWYGGGTEIARRIVQSGDGQLRLEMYPLTLRVARYTNDGIDASQHVHVQLSEHASIKNLRMNACKALGVPSGTAASRLWYSQREGEIKFFRPGSHLEQATVEDFEFEDEQLVAIEIGPLRKDVEHLEMEVESRLKMKGTMSGATGRRWGFITWVTHVI